MDTHFLREVNTAENIYQKYSRLSKNMEQIYTKTPAQENKACFLSNNYAFIKQKETTYVIYYTMDNKEIRRSNH